MGGLITGLKYGYSSIGDVGREPPEPSRSREGAGELHGLVDVEHLRELVGPEVDARAVADLEGGRVQAALVVARRTVPGLRVGLYVDLGERDVVCGQPGSGSRTVSAPGAAVHDDSGTLVECLDVALIQAHGHALL